MAVPLPLRRLTPAAAGPSARRRLLSIILLVLSPFGLAAQSRLVLRGKVIDGETKDPLPAYVSVKGAESGTSADHDGRFTLTLDSLPSGGPIILEVFQLGYRKKDVVADIGRPILVEMELEPLSAHEVVVTADSLMSEDSGRKTVSLKKMDIYTLPGTAADPLYASHILPGVNALPDSSSMLIRGGSAQEVAYYFDGIEISHPFLTDSLHESYFSIFDNQVIEGFRVSTSGFHARFGDALSGVMDIQAKDALTAREGGIGLSILGLNSYLGLPIKNTGSFIGSFNWGHSALMTAVNGRQESAFKTRHAFVKLNLSLSRAIRLRLVGLRDDYDFRHDTGFAVGSENDVAGLGFSFSPAGNLASQLTVSRTGHRSLFEVGSALTKEFRDRAFQVRWDTVLDLKSHYLEWGADLQRRELAFSLATDDGDSENAAAEGTRWGLYLSDKFRLAGDVYLTLGGRLSALALQGTEVNFDPRFSLAHFLTRRDILRFSAGLHHQYGDYFALRADRLKAKRAGHLALTYDRIGESLDLRLGLYHKKYWRLFLCRENAVSNGGSGFARGGEVFLKWKSAKSDLLFVYNLLRSKRKENEVPVLTTSPYEIKHSFTGILTYKFSTGSLGIRYSYAGGLPLTPLEGREWDETAGAFVPVWGEPYSQRYPSYHRLDINGNKRVSVDKRLVVLYFGITNLLNRKNILSYEYSGDYALRSDGYSIFGRSVFVGLYLPLF